MPTLINHDHVRAEVARLIQTDGAAALARRTGVKPDQLCRVAAGALVRAGTLARVAVALNLVQRGGES